MSASRRLMADWLKAKTTYKIIAALDAADPGGSRFVGGCVRNTLMGWPVDDIDIATRLHPERVSQVLIKAGIRAIPTGIEHGTITALVDGRPFEITTLRRDVETDGRRAVVAFTKDWAEDAARRDFRLNAIYAEADGTLHDPTGGGVEDAAAGRVIFIGDAEVRLREDYLRILRFFRFNAWYGGSINAEGLKACARQREGLRKIAAERIWKELKKLLSAPNPVATVLAMEQSGVLDTFLKSGNTKRLRHLVQVEKKASLPADPLRRLMTLIPRQRAGVVALGQDLRLSNIERSRLSAWVEFDVDGMSETHPETLRRAFYYHGVEAVSDYAMTEVGSLDDYRMVSAVLSLGAQWSRPEFPLRGGDVIAVGVPPGPKMGWLLKALEDWWVDGDFKADKGALMERLVDLTAD